MAGKIVKAGSEDPQYNNKEQQYRAAREDAKKVLKFYLRLMGRNMFDWNEDNDAEVERIIDDIDTMIHART